MSNAVNPRDTGGVSPLAAGRSVAAPPPRRNVVPAPATPPESTDTAATAPAPDVATPVTPRTAAPRPAPRKPTPKREPRPTDADDAQWAARGGFRTVAVQFTAKALEWFNTTRDRLGVSQRELLLDLLVQHGSSVKASTDAASANRAALGLSELKPRSRRGSDTRPVSLSVRPDEAVVLDEMAEAAGMSRSAFVDALIAAASKS